MLRGNITSNLAIGQFEAECCVFPIIMRKVFFSVGVIDNIDRNPPSPIST